MGCCHHSAQVDVRVLFVGFAKVSQIFDVPLRPADGRICNAKHRKVILLCVLQEVLQYLQMDGAVADDALFAHLFPARLELGLDEAGRLAALAQQRIQRREDQLQ